MLRCHILPAFGDDRLDAISRTEVKAFARTLTDRLSPATVRSPIRSASTSAAEDMANASRGRPAACDTLAKVVERAGLAGTERSRSAKPRK